MKTLLKPLLTLKFFLLALCFSHPVCVSQHFQSVVLTKYQHTGQYCSYDEMMNILDTLHFLYPSLLSEKESIGVTYENRQVWMINISINNDTVNRKPKILITSLMHANEPISMLASLHFVEYLLNSYNTDPEINYLLNTREVYFIPMLNPDGYEYSVNTNNHSWRRTRQVYHDGYGHSIAGVDLNRNFGYQYSADLSGGLFGFFNPNEWFSGRAVFDGWEAGSLRDKFYSLNFNFCINLHSHQSPFRPGYILYPWHFSLDNIPDSLHFKSMASKMATNTHFSVARTWDIFFEITGDEDSYPSGVAEDWMYYEKKKKRKTFPFTVSLSSPYFPSFNAIQEIIYETNIICLNGIRLTAGLLLIDSIKIFNNQQSPYIMPGDNGNIVLSITNLGIKKSDPILMNFSSLDTNIIINTPVVTFPALDSFTTMENTEFPVSFHCKSSAHSGHIIPVSVNYSVYSIPFEIIIGQPDDIFNDTIGNMNNWTIDNGWGVIADGYDDKYSLTDSPNGVYQNNMIYTLQLKNYVSFRNYIRPRLNFWTKWDIEENFDFATINLSTDHGHSWINLEGKYTRLASGKMPHQTNKNYRGYHGTQNSWVYETIALDEFQEQDSILLQFKMSTDGWIIKDGWFIDNIVLSGIPKSLPNIGKPKLKFNLYSNFPNPFNPSTSIKFRILKPTEVSLTIYNVLGQEVIRLVSKKHYEPGYHSIDWNGRNIRSQAVASGVYFYRLEAGGFSQTKKMLMIR